MSEKPTSNSVECALAIDPGRFKCGLAVVRKQGEGRGYEIVHRSVITRDRIDGVVLDLTKRYAPDVILVGNGTACEQYIQLLEQLNAGPVRVVDEKFSTLRARRRYFEEHPPKGLRRLIPTSLQTPPQPYDDYVAVLLAESFLSKTTPS